MVLGKTDIQKITMQYYSHFCCTDILKLEHGVHFICSKMRDSTLKGFGCKYLLYIFEGEDRFVVVYSPDLEDFIMTLKGLKGQALIAAIEAKYELEKMCLFMFEEERVLTYGDAKVLSVDDYTLFETFFKEANPLADPEGWLSEYFIKKAKKGYFAGYFKNDRLVSVCDAPDMPYMEGKIQHTGITTLENERHKGYGKCTGALATHHLLKLGICPQWECSIDNIASIELAKAIGYKEIAKAYIITG